MFTALGPIKAKEIYKNLVQLYINDGGGKRAWADTKLKEQDFNKAFDKAALTLLAHPYFIARYTATLSGNVDGDFNKAFDDTCKGIFFIFLRKNLSTSKTSLKYLIQYIE